MSKTSQTQIRPLSAPCLFIAGSREATEDMRRIAARTVHCARDEGWCSILVGDAPGIDQAVVAACERHGIPYVCVGVSSRPRIPASIYARFKTPLTGFRAYHERDCRLADQADGGVFIWDGLSRGTKSIYNYMKLLEKPAKLWVNGVVVWSPGQQMPLA